MPSLKAKNVFIERDANGNVRFRVMVGASGSESKGKNDVRRSRARNVNRVKNQILEDYSGRLTIHTRVGPHEVKKNGRIGKRRWRVTGHWR